MSTNQRYFIEISYRGTQYHGWQYQPNALSVQEKLDAALAAFLGKKVETLGCGRTDTGVHATQFFLHFDFDEEIYEQRFIKGLNAILPYDIAVLKLFKVSEQAHSRFDATSRSYEYHIHFQKNPFKTDTSWLIKESLDIKAMNIAAAIILEYNDFGAFCKSNADNFTNKCLVTKSEWEIKDHEIIFHITANRFLRNMVRAIVGTLVNVGKGKIKPEQIREIIESENRSNAGPSVPACGLFLTAVRYPYIERIKENKNNG